MLIGIDPLLSPEALFALRSMGHGDDLIIADANFPGDAIARQTVSGKLIRMDCDVPTALRAVLSVMPVDTYVEDAAARMEVIGAPSEMPEVQRQVAAILAERNATMIGIERFAFYERAKRAYAVIQTLDRRGYGDFAIRKGVIGPE